MYLVANVYFSCIVAMWKKKRVVKGIYSLIKKVDEHIDAIYDVYARWDSYLVKYYIREIQTNFIDEIEKKKKRIKITKELERDILVCYLRYEKVKSLSWDKS